MYIDISFFGSKDIKQKKPERSSVYRRKKRKPHHRNEQTPYDMI